MRKLHIIMPMAGEGSRFTKEGYTTPKPLIELRGVPLFARALRSLNGIRCDKMYSFVVRQEHITKHSIDKKITALYPNASIFSVVKTTRGAVETCLIAEPAIDTSESILVLDCDLEFKSENFNRLVENSLSLEYNKASGGILVSFRSKDPRYSYALPDSENRVLKTAEKEVISSHALIGAYFFANAGSFLLNAKKLLSYPVPDTKELYISLLFNMLIAQGDPVFLTKADEYRSFGTPEELRNYER